MVRKIMSEAITKSMSIGEVVTKYPETATTFMEWGLHCFGCAVARFETIEQGAVAHGIPTDDLVKALNEVVNNKQK
jgi:hybrid cluster-associated redox disulfide protein